MDDQQLIVALLVACAFGYSAWALMPRSWRRALMQGLGRSVPDSAEACGGCDNCDSAAPPKAAAKVIRIHRR